MDIALNGYDAKFVNGPDISSMVVKLPADVVAQRLTIRLRTFFSEWFINTDYGVPYFERILRKGVNKTTVDNILREQILDEVGVLEIVSFDSTFNAGARTYSCSFQVRTASGTSQTVTVSV